MAFIRLTVVAGCKILQGLVFVCLVLQGFQQTHGQEFEDQVTGLVQDLESDSYAKRKSAAKRLSKIGSRAVPYLAKSTLQGQPETRCQCLRILLHMKISDDDAHTFKSALILRCLADAGFPQFESKISAIVTSWKIGKTKQNISKLEKFGAKITQYEMSPRTVTSAPIFIEHRGSFEDLDSARISSPTNHRPSKTKVKTAELISQIDEHSNQNGELARTEFIETIAKPRPTDLAQPLQIHSLDVGRGGVINVDFNGSKPFSTSIIQRIEFNENWKGTREAFDIISLLPNIPSINLRNIKIDQALLDEISKLNNVRQITIDNATFETKTLIDFAKSRPDINIINTTKAFLGVTAATTLSNPNEAPVGVEIGSVVDGSAAHEAELKVGDIIAGIAGIEVETFNDLRLIISTLSPNVALPMVIVRAGEKMEIEVTLKRPDSIPDAFQPID